MASYLLRCSLPDRPGALGLVASRIGAVRGDITAVEVRRRLEEFVLPYSEIRNRRAGYAVSIVKAGTAATSPAPAMDAPDDAAV